MTAASIDLRHAGVLRRAKPLLGTLVDIGIGAMDADIALAATNAAFDEIRDVHRLMSFHEASSDLSRINRAAPGQRVEIDPRTADVLRLALEIGDASAGAFDCTVAPVLVRHGLLPPVPDREAPMALEPADARLVHSRDPVVARIPAFAIEDCTLIKQRDCLLDLGGIAKGYAVDRAVDAALALADARGHRLDSVLVNAGGDLRFHGAGAMTIRLRDFDDPAQLTGVVEVSAGALATSSTRGLDGLARRVSPLVDPLGEMPLPMGAGVTVAAPSCAVADALTKVVLVAGDRARTVLARYRASIVRFSARRAPLAETP
ncbi:FAD:protein FMN transferase [Burkholderia sp. S-53]|uniref:FAD:protein FMN transferase n=1 Tax=Burkholderia sp. S-53 TaxID=2906514 RepID=UPI0021CEF682|nr:FAD:protein FMN transferase [Burkholderia sp. S-53]UXU90080.1 FAD:protein FMN transferase [Burkholderia sp. S-53]